MTANTGILYVVATPIGNLQDITLRAIDTLKTVDWIAAEDTRHSASLLQHYNISTPIFSLHEHNEREKTHKILTLLAEGKNVALITDAGTPLISDPGTHLVKAVKDQGYTVIPIPGPCAAIAALSASGLPTNHFLFTGFLPAKSKARQDALSNLKNTPYTLIFYEAPHRITDMLNDMQTIFGPECQVVIARELTKKFETIYSGPLIEILKKVTQDTNQQRGEIVVLVAGNQTTTDAASTNETLKLLLDNDIPVKKAAEIASKITGARKNELYEMALNIKKEKPI